MLTCYVGSYYAKAVTLSYSIRLITTAFTTTTSSPHAVETEKLTTNYPTEKQPCKINTREISNAKYINKD